MKVTLAKVTKCNTVGDLLSKLKEIAKDPNVKSVLDATIDGPDGETFTGFKLIEYKLSDGSQVLGFEFFEDTTGSRL